jgi:hypothetical protein
LCAPTFLARKSFFETYGQFKQGLIQLQDFEMWVRACRMGANVAMSQTRTLRYRVRNRSANLSAQHVGRTTFEDRHVYRSFFDGASIDLLTKAFPGFVVGDKHDRDLETECDLLFLYINHVSPFVREIGADKITAAMDDPVMRKLLAGRGFTESDLFALTDKFQP